ncbi:hypothetical protein [Shewanella waksmanii]|uniref:hypothetical protein n=1 Tax=Shewanella waksmanii TaxID=213783 RepID=UPI0037353FE6
MMGFRPPPVVGIHGLMDLAGFLSPPVVGTHGLMGLAGVLSPPAGCVLEGGSLHWSLLPAAGLCADAFSARC